MIIVVVARAIAMKISAVAPAKVSVVASNSAANVVD